MSYQTGQDEAGNLKGHNHPPAFGKRITGCLRCEALRAGARPVQWHSRVSEDARHAEDVRAHFSGHRHLSGGCGPVCTFGEW